jgi:protein-tyrosine phosphatase
LLSKKNIVPEGAIRYPQPCSFADFEQANLIIALKEAEHRPLIEKRFPDVASRGILACRRHRSCRSKERAGDG